MKDAGGDVVGIRLRSVSGQKFAVTGSHNGLFIPRALPNLHGAPLFICEGPTDTAAMLDLGFNVVGRASCNTGSRLLSQYIGLVHPAEVVIVADADAPGRDGAGRLASALVAYVPCLRVITPPDGINDARAWKRTGATQSDIRTAIAAAVPRKLNIVVRNVNVKEGC